MKKLLFQFDTDFHPSVFDTVAAYDGGADHVSAYGGVAPENVGKLVDGAIFTRAPRDKKNTALFIGGGDMAAGEALLHAVEQHFFPGFQVSVMLDSNGCNTTAAAAVVKILKSSAGDVSGKKAVVLAGTGPVGQRAAGLLARLGAEVCISSRRTDNAERAADAVNRRFNVEVRAAGATDAEARADLIADAHIVLATGAAGVELLSAEHWTGLPRLQVLADANATPPAGLGGVDIMAKGELAHGKILWGAIGFGASKLALHRACIARLFTANKLILDAEQIFAIAREMESC